MYEHVSTPELMYLTQGAYDYTDGLLTLRGLDTNRIAPSDCTAYAWSRQANKNKIQETLSMRDNS